MDQGAELLKVLHGIEGDLSFMCFLMICFLLFKNMGHK